MGLDNSGGPGKGPETTDPPATSSERPATPPAETNGQYSRLESLRLAREAQQQDNGTPPSQGKDSGPAPAEEREDDKSGPVENGNGGTDAEKPDQTGTEEPREDEGERDPADPVPETGRSETGETGGEDDPGKEPSSQDSGSTADDTAPGEQQSNLPAEASQYPPGSRLESLARARAEQHPNAEEQRAKLQDTKAADGTGEGTAGKNDDEGAQPESEDAGKAEPGQDARLPDAEIPTDDTDGTGADSGSDQHLPPASVEGAEPLAPEAAQPQDQGQDLVPPPDSADAGDSGDVGGDPPREPAADGLAPADDQPRDGEGDPQPSTDVVPPPDPIIESGPPDQTPGHEADPAEPQGEAADQDTENPEPPVGGETTDSDAGDPIPAGETTPPPEGTSENVTPPEGLGEQNDGHGRNAEGPDPIESSDETSSPDREDEQSGESEESGTELAPHEEESTDIEPSRFAGSVKITLDRDGRPLPPERPGTDTETPGRGELRRPEDDRASRDYQEQDPDNPSRLRGELKRFFDKSGDTKNFVDKFSEPAQKTLERAKPTGQLCAARPNTDHIKASDQSVKYGDTVLGAVGTVIVFAEIVRLGANLARRTRRSEHVDH
ncbi:hypothetical protein [Actinomadura sp. WMMA1423]|uniref:hypothetical protein n=1 Tax=Actinomadura sp. WMMA1423 TaxID=2591108 RepID=UPI0011463377|nr:hypothetical protein [Actinomadura sp. WMMA1423]